MIRYFLILTSCFALWACGQPKQSDKVTGLTIDKNIKREVEKYIQNSKQFEPLADKMQIYENSVFVESYENDSLAFKSGRNPNKQLFKSFYLYKQLFKSFYLWKRGMLTIDGAFGLFGGIGFAIKIDKNKAALYHLLSSDDFPSYAYNKSDSLQFRLEVPCRDTKIILSEIPDSTKKQIIYGYVEFKSSFYYEAGNEVNKKETSSRVKRKDNMKIYFKSSWLALKD